MQHTDFRLPAPDGAAIFVRSFLPDGPARALVQLAHGLAEHSARYERFATALTDIGIGLYANDHRGHGQTATGREQLGYFADYDGWHKVVRDQRLLFEEIESRHQGAPVFLMGHSMGSFIARSAMRDLSHQVAGLILSATTHELQITVQAGRAVAAAERARLGKRGKSWLLKKLTFDAYNAQIDDPRTSCDWLSRDPHEVDKYVADPLCGFESSTQLYCDLFGGMAEIFTQDALAALPSTLPIYILAGEHDPLNGRLSAIKRLHRALEEAGVRDVTLRVYAGARHELLNETNRDEVTRDLLAWLGERLSSIA